MEYSTARASGDIRTQSSPTDGRWRLVAKTVPWVPRTKRWTSPEPVRMTLTQREWWGFGDVDSDVTIAEPCLLRSTPASSVAFET